MNIHRASIRIAIGLLALLAATFPAPASAEPRDPATIFPESTLLYVARMGSLHTNAAAAETPWGRLLAEPQVRHFWTATTGALDEFIVAQAGEEDPAAVHAYRSAVAILAAFEKHPTALAILDAGMGEAGPRVQVALACQSGDATDDLVKQFDRFAQLTGAPPGEVALVGGHSLTRIPLPLPVSIYYGKIAENFVLALGEDTVKIVAKGLSASAADKSLAAAPSLRLARERIGGNDASRSWCVYLDVASTLERLRPLLPMIAQGDADKAKSIEKVIAATGLDSVKSFCWEQHYRDNACVSGTFLHTPNGGRGLFAPSASQLSDDDLALLPKNPSWATAFKFDIARLYRGIIETVEQLDEESGKSARAAIAEVEQKIGFSLDEQFLGLIGDTILLYDTPDSGGVWFTGMTAIVSVKDEEQLRTRVHSLVKTIDDIAPDVGLTGKFECKISSFEHRGHTVEFLNLTGIPMPIAPAWTFHEGRLIKSFYPQMVTAALDRLMDGDPKTDSILANADAMAARKVIGDAGSSFAYIDSRAGLASAYPFVLLFGQVGAAMAQGAGAKIDVTALPPLATLQRHIHADVRVTRQDEQGILSLAHGAWPLPSTPSFSTGIASSSMVAAILMPSLRRARELAKRTVCASNMRALGQALYITAMSREGERFPDDIRDVLTDNSASDSMFVCPSTAASPDEIAKSVDACYIYIPGSSTSSHPGNVLIYERFENHDGEGVNVLFQDGHVQFIGDLDEAQRLIDETKARIAEEHNAQP